MPCMLYSMLFGNVKSGFFQDNKATFTFPDFYKENKSEQDKSVEEFVDMQKKTDHEAEKTWHRTDLPPWFR